MSDPPEREKARIWGPWNSQAIETDMLSRGKSGDVDGPDTAVTVRVRLVGIITGVVVGLALGLNVYISGVTHVFWLSISVLIGILWVWGNKTPASILKAGLSGLVLFLAMVPVTYYLPRLLGPDRFGNSTMLISLAIWIALAVALTVILRGGLSSAPVEAYTAGE